MTEPMSEDVRATAREALRRDAELTSGEVEAVTHEEVMAEVRQIIAHHRHSDDKKHRQ